MQCKKLRKSQGTSIKFQIRSRKLRTWQGCWL